MKYLLSLMLVTIFGVMPCLAASDQAADLKSDKAKINYSVGYQIGGDFKNQGVELDPDALVKGIQDAISGGKPMMSEEEMRTTLIELKKKIVDDQIANLQRVAAERHAEGAAFLKANATKEGVVVLPSGLQYKILKAGTGATPTLDDTVTVNYRGTRINGKEFSSTYRDNKPDTIQVSKVIPGMQEALTKMKVGGKWELYIPSKLGFGEHGPLEGDAVIYEVELLSIEPKK